jgi:hypothetical protein
MGWQPIATAPQDGTWVLLRGGSTTDEYCLDHESDADTKRPVTAKWHDSEWVFAFWDGEWRSQYSNPTEWRIP